MDGAGRLDAAIIRNVNAWDIAAGMLLVREAGGYAVDPDSDRSALDTGNILACNGELLPAFKAALKEAGKSET